MTMKQMMQIQNMSVSADVPRSENGTGSESASARENETVRFDSTGTTCRTGKTQHGTRCAAEETGSVIVIARRGIFDDRTTHDERVAMLMSTDSTGTDTATTWISSSNSNSARGTWTNVTGEAVVHQHLSMTGFATERRVQESRVCGDGGTLGIRPGRRRIRLDGYDYDVYEGMDDTIPFARFAAI
jgi:hypothetical protein